MNNFIKFFTGFLISSGLVALVMAAVYFLGGLLALMGNQSSLVEDTVTILGILVSFVLPLIMFLRFRAGSPLLARGIGVGLVVAGVLEIYFWLIAYGVLPYVILF